MTSVINGLFAVVIFAVSMSVHARSTPEPAEPLYVECITEGTTPMGERRSCTHRQCTSVPSGYVFIENRMSLQQVGDRGSANSCSKDFENRRELQHGIAQATRICVNVHAVSDGGMVNIGVRGFTRCRLSGFLTRVSE
jgi:hypothetical protein